MAILALNGGEPVRKRPYPKYPTYGKAEEDAAVRAIRSGILCSGMQKAGQGEVAGFEREFAEYCSAGFAIATSNGTTALHVALAACGIGPGDEVIVPPYTFLSTGSSVLMQNAIPVFADIEPMTLGLDPESVRERLTPRTKAVMLVHMNGVPADVDGIVALARERDLILIEDCSHAHGAEYGGRKVGTFGQMGAFSLQQKKNLSVGEGGIVITSDAELSKRARSIRTLGRETGLGFNFRMPEIHGAIGRVRLERLDEQNAQRIRNAEVLDEALRGLDGFEPPTVRPETKAVYYNYVARCDPKHFGVPKEKLVEALQAEGIPVSKGYHPIYRDPTFRGRDSYGRGCPFSCHLSRSDAPDWPDYGDGICPVAEDLCDNRAIELKIHPPADEGDMREAAEAFTKIAEHLQELQ